MKSSIFLMMIAAFCMSFTNTCSDDQGNITSVKYGTSFGECMGYCRNEITLQEGIWKQVSSGWSDTLEPRVVKLTYDPSVWEDIQLKTDLDAFFSLPDVIGCPDCADGGAEWLEIKTDTGEVNKVTWEYGNVPEELREVIAVLKGLLSREQ